MERAVVREHFVTEFGHVGGRRCTSAVERHGPQLVICDEMDVGAVVAAELTRVPCVTVGVIAAGRLVSPAVVGPAGSPAHRPRSHRRPALPPSAPPSASRPRPPSFRDPHVGTPFALHAVRPPILADVLTRRVPPGHRTSCTPRSAPSSTCESGDLLARVVERCRPSTRVRRDGRAVGRPDELPPDAGARVRVELFVPRTSCSATAPPSSATAAPAR